MICTRYTEVSICIFFSSRRRHTSCALVTGVQTCALPICVNSDPSAHPWTAPEATRPERLLSTSARPPRPACPSPLRLGQAIDPIEQEPGMPTSKIDRMPLLLVALVLAAAAVPGRALDLDPRHDGIDTDALSVTVTNNSRRRVDPLALRETVGI